MDLDDFKGIVKKEKPLPTDAEGWVGLFLTELDLPELSSYDDLKVYLEKYAEGSDSKEEDLVKDVPQNWYALDDNDNDD